MGLDEEAWSLYQRALGMYERSVGTNQPEAVETRTHYAALLKNIGPSKESSAADPSSSDSSHESEEQASWQNKQCVTIVTP